MSVTYTPGKWAVSPFRAQVICDKFGIDGDFLPVAQMLWPTTERTEAETYANANLMAAAPDLLEALKAAYEVLMGLPGDWDGGNFACDKASAAINKACGDKA